MRSSAHQRPSSRFHSAVFLCCAYSFMAVSATVPVSAQETPLAEFTAADVFPATTAAYVEIPGPGQIVSDILQHPITGRLQQLDAWKQALREPQMTGVITAKNFLELQMGLPWQEVLSAVSAKGVYLAVDATDNSVMLMVRGRDADLMQEVRLKLLELTRLGGGEIRKLDTYRDIPVYRLQQGGAAVVGEWLVLASTAPAGRGLIDRMLDYTATSPQSLAALPAFNAARPAAEQLPAIRAWLGLAAIRNSGRLQRAFSDRIDNPPAEFLFGGLQSVLAQADWVTAELRPADSGLKLQLTTPFNSVWIPETREWYFGPNASGRTPTVPDVPQLLGSVAIYRNVSEMWLRAGDLFSEQINDRMAEAESNLGNIFAGRDFGEEVLGAFEPGMLLVAARQDFARINPTPAIRLPAFALVLTLKDPEVMRPELRRLFQSIIGFGNIVGAQQGQPQLEMDMQKLDDAELITARYLPPRPSAAPAPVPIVYNFAPTAAFQGSRFILASTTSFAESLLNAESIAAAPANTAVSLSVPVLQDVFRDNRDSIVSGNMLSKGQTREEADAELDTILELLGWFQGLRARLTPSETSLQLELQLQTATGLAAPEPAAGDSPNAP
ncbi:MAG: hypothetical protein RLZZ458_1153 [Planctomycetota bacterium]